MFNKEAFAAFTTVSNTKSVEAKSMEQEVSVLSVTDWKPTSTGLAVKMVRTTIGSFWPLASAITNLPSSIALGKPVVAKAVITEAKTPNADGTPRFNMSRLEFPGLPTNTLLAIQAMPAGTALFANASALN